MTEAEDLAYAKNSPPIAVALVNRLVRTDISEMECMLVGKVIADQLEIPKESVFRDIRLARSAILKLSGVAATTGSLEAFLADKDFCLLGDERACLTRRPAFYKAYVEWCRINRFRPSGKMAVYEQLQLSSIEALGVRLGTDSKGNDVVRGVMMADEEM